ncbi:MAG: trypsin-like peptidase domain-containing protein [Planctomycetota bacterium]
MWTPLYRTLTSSFLGAALLAGSAGLAHGDEGRGERRSDIVKVVEMARPAVVSIRTNQLVQRVWYPFMDLPLTGPVEERDGGLGSGAIFHPDGYVMTNAHVLARASKVFVSIPSPDGTPIERRALPLAVDIPNDLAILRIEREAGDGDRSWPHLDLGRSNDLMLGETVIAMGHPFRLGFTVTQGIISGTGRSLDIKGQQFHDFLQVDAAINPGNSGGPLFDVTGRWIGVNTAIYNRASGAEGIGFAIPADRVRSLVARAFKRRLVSQDWIGLDLDEGPLGEARVERVFPHGPARDADIRPGDIIVSIDGEGVPTLFDARLRLLDHARGAPVQLVVQRRAGERSIDKRVDVRVEPLPTDGLSRQRLGFTAEETDLFDGVRVVAVRPGSPSDKIGLKRGDVIVGLGGYRIRSSEDLLLFLQYVSSGDIVKVRVSGASRPQDWRAGGMVGDLQGVLQAE